MLDCHIENLSQLSTRQHCQSRPPPFAFIPPALPFFVDLSRLPYRKFMSRNFCNAISSTFRVVLGSSEFRPKHFGELEEHHDVSAATDCLPVAPPLLTPSLSFRSLSCCAWLTTAAASAATKQNINMKYAINDILP